LTDTTEVAAEAIAPETDTDVAVDAPVEAVEAPAEPEAAAAPAPAAAAKENRFPKVVKREEVAGITHYAPKAHEELDPSSRFTD